MSTLFKLNPAGTALLWKSSAFGGAGTSISQIAVSAGGEVHVAGNTSSADFAITEGTNRTIPFIGNTSGFLAEVKAGNGRVKWATYLVGGDRDLVRALAVDVTGVCYVAGLGSSADVPQIGAVQSRTGLTSVGFVMAIMPGGSGVKWSTPLGLSGPTLIALGGGSAADVYVAGNVNPGMLVANIADGTSGAQTIEVAKLQQEGAPVQIEAVVNAASGQPGVPLVGGAASMYVDRPLEPSGISILLGTAPVFVLGVAGRQINFQVPYEARRNSDSRYPIELRYAGLSSFALPPDTGPGIFTLADGSGAIQHSSDYALVTRASPAVPGEVIIVYLTGLGYAGQKTGVPPSGPAQASNCYPPTSNAGEVLYAGVTPGVVGLYQMNIRLRADLPSGDFGLVVTRNDCSPPPLTPAYRPYPVRRDSNTVTMPVR